MTNVEVEATAEYVAKRKRRANKKAEEAKNKKKITS